MKKRRTTLQRYAQLSKSVRAERKQLIRQLQTKGLVSKRANLKSPKVRAGLLDKFRDVLTRKATVVKVPRGFKVKSLKKSFRVQGLNIVIPHAKGERVRVEKSTGHITSTRVFKGQRIKRIIQTSGRIPKARKGKKLFFSLEFAQGRRVRFDSHKALEEYMAGDSFKYTFKNWRDYMEIEEVNADDEEGAEDE